MPYLGEICAVGAAVSWAAAVILFRKSGYRVRPLELNIFKSTFALPFLIVTIPLFGEALIPKCPLNDWLILLLSGVIGITLADTLFFISLERLGAGLTAVVDCMYSPSLIFLSFIFLGEWIGFQGYLAAALVASAILIGALGGALPGTRPKDLAIGISAGVISMILMGVGVVLTKKILDRSPLLWTSTVRMVGGVAGLLLVAAFWPGKRKPLRVFVPSKVWKVMVPAALIGNYVAFIFWMGGFKFTMVSIAAILNQLSTIFIFLLAAPFLGERITSRRTAAVLVAMAGAALAVLR